MKKHNPALTDRARELRKNMTEEEKQLWYRFLHNYPIRFLRQKVVGNYIVDFYCAKAKLVIELDGAQHYEDQGIQYDAERTAFLEGFGLTVIRIPNTQIQQHYNDTCEYIDKITQELLNSTT